MLIRNFALTTTSMHIHLVAAIILFCVQHFAKPIGCRTPSHFTNDMILATEKHCMVNGQGLHTERELANKQLPNHTIEQDDGSPYLKKDMISYLYLLPAVLFLQGLIGFLPNFSWYLVAKRNVLNIEDDSRYGLFRFDNNVPLDSAKTEATSLAKQLFSRLLEREKLDPFFFEQHLLFSYYTCIMMNIFCFLIQYFVYCFCFGIFFSSWGNRSKFELFIGKNFATMFPSEVSCSVEFIEHGVIHTYNFECEHYLNYFTENMMIVIWYWTACFAFYYGYAVYQWSNMMEKFKNKHYLYNFLKDDRAFMEEKSDRCNRISLDFFRKYMKGDGFFVAHQLTAGKGKAFSKKFYSELFKCWLEKYNEISKEERLYDLLHEAHQDYINSEENHAFVPLCQFLHCNANHTH